MQDVSQKEIIAEIVKGDDSAFKEVYRQYYSMLCGYALKYMDDREQCEDIVQNTLVKIWENRAKLAGLTNMKAYLISAVRNSCINELEHQKVVNKYNSSAVIEIKMLSAQCESELLEDEELPLADQVLASIEELPTQCAQIFKMKYLEGLRTKEIAELTRLSPRTVESHVFNALKTLRSRFSLVLPFFILLTGNFILKF